MKNADIAVQIETDGMPGCSVVKINDAVVPSVMEWSISYDAGGGFPILVMKIGLEPGVLVNIDGKDIPQ